MTSPQQYTVIDPGLTDVLKILKQEIFASLNCVKVGQITAFDATRKAATVQVLFKALKPDGTIVSYRPLLDCPVFTLQGGGGAIQFPIAAGDQCLVLFSDNRLDEWFANGSEALPGDLRKHDLSDAIAIVGLNALNSSLATYPSNKVLLTYLNSIVELDAAGVKTIGSGGAEVDLQAAIVTIKNNSTTLLTLINGFITLMEAAAVQDDEGGIILPFTPAFIALLEAYKAQFATLLG